MSSNGVQGERNIQLEALYGIEKEIEKDEFFKTASFKPLQEEKENRSDNAEIKHLQDLCRRISRELGKYQKLAGFKVPSDLNKSDQNKDDFPTFMNSEYYLAPLLLSYDEYLYNFESELKRKDADLKKKVAK